MIELVINHNSASLEQIWYHYSIKNIVNEQYQLNISLDELEIIDCIQKYAQCSIKSEYLEANILQRDVTRMSLGLIWELLHILKKIGLITGGEKVNYIINNIKCVHVSNEYLTIAGDLSRN